MYGRGDKYRQRDRQRNRQNDRHRENERHLEIERQRRYDDYERHDSEGSRSRSWSRDERESDYHSNNHDWEDDTFRRDQQDRRYIEERHGVEDEISHRRQSSIGSTHHDEAPEYESPGWDTRGMVDEVEPEFERNEVRVRRNSPNRPANRHDPTFQSYRQNQSYREDGERGDRVNRRDRKYDEHEDHRISRSENNRPSRSFDGDPDDDYFTEPRHSSGLKYNRSSSPMSSTASERREQGYENFDRDSLENEVVDRRRYNVDVGLTRHDARQEYEGPEFDMHGSLDEAELERDDLPRIDPHGRRNRPIRHDNRHDLVLRNDQQNQRNREEQFDRGHSDRHDRVSAELEDRRDMRNEINRPSRSHTRRNFDGDPDDDYLTETHHSIRDRSNNQSSSMGSAASERRVRHYKEFDRLRMDNEVDLRRRDNVYVGFTRNERPEFDTRGRIDEVELDREDLAGIEPRGQRSILGRHKRHDSTFQNDQLDQRYGEEFIDRGSRDRMSRRDREHTDFELSSDLRSESDLPHQYYSSENIGHSPSFDSTERYVDDDKDFTELSMENERDHRSPGRIRARSVQHGLKRKHETSELASQRLIRTAEYEREILGRREPQGRRRLDGDVIRDRSPLQYADDKEHKELRRRRLMEEDFHDVRSLPQNRSDKNDESLMEGVLGHAQMDEEQTLTKLFERQVVQAEVAILSKGAAEKRLPLETTSERSRKCHKERLRDRSPSDTGSLKGQMIGRSRIVQRTESCLRRNAPVRRLSSLQSNSKPNVNLGKELDFTDQHSFDKEINYKYDQVSDDEIEEDFDEGFEPKFQGNVNQQQDPIFPKMFTDPTLDKDPYEGAAFEQSFKKGLDNLYPLNVDERLQEQDIVNMDPFGCIEQIQNVDFASSDFLNELPANVSEPSFIHHAVTVPQPQDTVCEPLQMQPFVEFEIALPICAPFMEGLPQTSNVVPCPKIVNTQPDIFRNVQGPDTVSIPLQPNLGGNLKPAIVGRFPRSGIGTMPLRPSNPGIPLGPGIYGMPPRACIDGMPPRPDIHGMPPRPDIHGMPPRPDIHGMPPRLGGGEMPPRPGIGGMPPRPGVGGMPPKPGVGGMPPRPGIGGMPPRLGMVGMPPKPDVGGMTPKPGFGGMTPRPSVGEMPPRPGIGGMPPRPVVGGMPPRHGMVGMPPRLDIGELPPRSCIGGMPPRPDTVRMSLRPGNPVMPHTLVNPVMPPRPGIVSVPQRPGIVSVPQRPGNHGIPSRPDIHGQNIACKFLNNSSDSDTASKPKTACSPQQNSTTSGVPSIADCDESIPNQTNFEMALPTRKYIRFQASMKCPVCLDSEIFQNETAFDFHWKMVHFKVRENIFCPVEGCDTFENTTLKLQEHFINEHNKGLEELNVNNQQKLLLAKKEKFDNPLYKDPGELVYNHKEKTYVVFSAGMKCPVCLTSCFENVEAFKEHWQVFHARYTKKFFCSSDGCSTNMTSIEKLKKHYWKKHNYGNDELTLAAMETLNEAKYRIMKSDSYIYPGKLIFDGCKPLHVKFEAGMLCPICPGQRLRSLDKYQQHWQNRHAEFDEYLVCPVDGCECYHSKSRMEMHLCSEHNLTNHEAVAKIITAKKEMRPNKRYKDPQDCIFTSLESSKFYFTVGMKCPGCKSNIKYEAENEFFDHWKTHMKYNQKYECPVRSCRALKTSIQKLRLHISQVHQNLTLEEENLCETVENLGAVLVERKHYIDPGEYEYVRDSSVVDQNSDEERDSNQNSDDESDTDQRDKEEIKFVQGLQCPICKWENRYENINKFKSHWVNSHFKYFDRYVCPADFCNCQTGSRIRLKEHYREKHSEFSHGDAVSMMLDDVPLLKKRNKRYVTRKNYWFDFERVSAGNQESSPLNISTEDGGLEENFMSSSKPERHQLSKQGTTQARLYGRVM